jgi:hypothetical protein
MFLLELLLLWVSTQFLPVYTLHSALQPEKIKFTLKKKFGHFSLLT